MKIIFDIETDGIDATKIHCFSYCIIDETYTFTEVKTLVDYEDIKNLLNSPNLTTLIGHNIIRYDIPTLEKLLNIIITQELIDTLSLSWYLYPNLKKHGLENHGKDFNMLKIEIKDWKNLSIEDYIKRCEQDVLINTKLFNNQMSYLQDLYGDNGQVLRLIRYLIFKMDCAKEQEQVKWKLDKKTCLKNFLKLKKVQSEKELELSKILPDNITYESKKRPSKMLKKDGSLSETGKKWLELLKEKGFSPDYQGEVTIEKTKESGNSSSPIQVKNFLFSLGWKPTFYKITITKKGQNKVPQVAVNGELCQGIKDLYPKCPELQALESLSIINHRINILKGFLRDVDENDYLTARIRGLTNTLRFQHAEIVNLPAVDKPYGKEIRECLTCEENEILYGCDMTNIEDKTKRHYMYFFDPNYVKEMETPDFDAHLDIALLAGFLTKEQVFNHKNKLEDYSSVRKKAKIVNFSAIYGIGASKMSATTGMSIKDCEKLLKTYWQRNWAVKKVSNSLKTKIVNNQTWLYNPVSKFWYSLRVEKDKFSTLNQGTASFCFDIFLSEYRKQKIGVVCGQVHDELVGRIPDQEIFRRLVLEATEIAIKNTNERLKLNVTLGYSGQFGKCYLDIH